MIVSEWYRKNGTKEIHMPGAGRIHTGMQVIESGGRLAVVPMGTQPEEVFSGNYRDEGDCYICDLVKSNWQEQPSTRDLIDIYTGEVIRKATVAELIESDEAVDTGAITVEIDGEDRTCYVEAKQ